jgi:hypothetical protein
MFLTIGYRCIQSAKQILFTVEFDGAVIASTYLDGQKHECYHHLDGNQEPRTVQVQLMLQGKTQEHTVVDQENQIIKDCAVIIDSIVIDSIDVTDIFCQGLPCYQHDTNGTSQSFIDEFYGYMGCNGVVKIEFALPIHKWFLDRCH